MKKKKRVKYNPKLYKNQILAWAQKNGRLPNRKGKGTIERRFGARMENYLCASSGCYDPEFRALIYELFPRKINNKRKHDKEGRIKELLSFIAKNHRTPSVIIPEEKILVSTLNNFSRPTSYLYSHTVERSVLRIDKCFRTKIAKRYRKCINQALEGSKLVEE